MEYSLGPIVPFFFLFILAYLLTRNQGSLEYLVERRKNASTNLPNRIRRYNMLLLVILVAAVFVLFLLQDFIGAGIEQLLHLLRSLLAGLVQLYLWLVGLFSSEDTETVIGEESMMESQPITAESPSGSVFWDVLTVLLIAAGAVLLIRFLPNILRWIGRLLRSAYLKLVELAYGVQPGPDRSLFLPGRG